MIPTLRPDPATPTTDDRLPDSALRRPVGRRSGDGSADAGPWLALTRLDVREFRCYAQARLELDRRPVVLTGPNGAGKTNLLEAVSFLAPGRGLRRATLAEVRRHAAPPEAVWAVSGRLESPGLAGGAVQIGTGQDAEGSGRRIVRIDGTAVSSQTALGDYLALVWLTPQMDRLFLEGASNRRRFLDRLVYGFHPDHAGRLAAYEHALRERSRLLKEGRRDDRWLAALEETLATTGVAVAAARREVVGWLDGVAGDAADSAFPQARMRMAGGVEEALADRPALAVEDWLRARLAENRRADAAAGGATLGPHRSDLAVRHAGKAMPAEHCSTGEQKALLIGIVLANARLLTASRGLPPVLLLDEVAAHLDSLRREALYEALLALGGQAWLTGTDAALFAAFGDRARHLRVEEATVRDLA